MEQRSFIEVLTRRTERIRGPGEPAAVFRAFVEAVEARLEPPGGGPKVRLPGDLRPGSGR